MLKQENLDRYKYITFSFIVVEVKMQCVCVRERIEFPKIMHVFILTSMN